MTEITNQEEYLAPHTIWHRRKDGRIERVYIESLSSRLLQKGTGYIDIRTPFGSESIRRDKFLSQYTFSGWARVRLNEIAEVKNLIPFIGEMNNDRND